MKMKGYPIELFLTDSTKVLVRPIESDEIESLQKFYAKIPKYDFLVYSDSRSDNFKPEESFYLQENANAFKLGALINDELVAKGTLHSEGLYLSNAGEIKLIVDPKYRNKRLGSQIFNLLLFEGLRLGYKKIIVRYSLENRHFTKILNYYGFYPETTLNFYIDDIETNQRKDIIIASFDLENWRRRFEFYNVIDKS
jgi:RimJ/RimL family protein N-acetyltransferase